MKAARPVCKVNRKQKKLMLLGVFLVVAIAWLLTFLFPRPAAGDSAFEALGTLFSGLAFAGVIAALYMQKHELALQRKELRLQRRELKETKAELKRSAAAQEHSEEHLKKQAETLAASSRLDAIRFLLTLGTSSNYELRTMLEDACQQDMKEGGWRDPAWPTEVKVWLRDLVKNVRKDRDEAPGASHGEIEEKKGAAKKLRELILEGQEIRKNCANPPEDLPGWTVARHKAEEMVQGWEDQAIEFIRKEMPDYEPEFFDETLSTPGERDPSWLIRLDRRLAALRAIREKCSRPLTD